MEAAAATTTATALEAKVRNAQDNLGFALRFSPPHTLDRFHSLSSNPKQYTKKVSKGRGMFPN